MKNEIYVSLVPSPSALVQALRDIGYSMETAVADIVDNSITAEATAVWIRFSWDGGSPWLAIIDNGHGMSKDGLIDAMRFGSKNPQEMRSPEDLGRFGLGMKTASFSQCRHLIVLSKKNGQLSGCEWNIDQICGDGGGEWLLGIVDVDLLKTHKTLSSLYEEYLHKAGSGTVVLWKKFDRLESHVPTEARERVFGSLMDETRKHLELVFHRFLAYEPRRRHVVISMNGDELEAFNPFNPTNLATQELEEQRFEIDGQEIVVQPYILPHHNKVSQEEYEKYAGEGGYLENQGLYIYRNRRLIIKGTWFRLIKKAELNKLIRIRVDIPNTLDHLWKIDVKKSNATPPETVRRELRQIIGKIEVKGRKVYQQRGQRLSSSVKTPAWTRRVSGGTVIYAINREHPLLERLLQGMSPEQADLTMDFVSIVETSFPKDLFFNDVAGSPEQVQPPEFDDDSLGRLLDLFLSQWATTGSPDLDVVKSLLTMDPFAACDSQTRAILKKRGYPI